MSEIQVLSLSTNSSTSGSRNLDCVAPAPFQPLISPFLKQTSCKLHSRDFSDCFKYHKQHPCFLDKLCPSLNGGNIVVIPLNKLTQVQLPNPNNKLRKVDEVVSSDPMKTLGADIMEMVFMLLDAHSLARSGSSSKLWRSLAHSDPLWVTKISSFSRMSQTQCTNLWAGKQRISVEALKPGLSKLAAYGISLQDSKRCAITMDDLCERSWEFRFKDNVPQYWLELDPSRQGEAPMRRYFHRDGSQSAPENDPVWGGHESTFTISKNLEQETRVRINSWPEMSVSRTSDWGWKLQNSFYVYFSLPSP